MRFGIAVLEGDVFFFSSSGRFFSMTYCNLVYCVSRSLDQLLFQAAVAVYNARLFSNVTKHIA